MIIGKHKVFSSLVHGYLTLPFVGFISLLLHCSTSYLSPFCMQLILPFSHAAPHLLHPFIFHSIPLSHLSPSLLKIALLQSRLIFWSFRLPFSLPFGCFLFFLLFSVAVGEKACRLIHQLQLSVLSGLSGCGPGPTDRAPGCVPVTILAVWTWTLGERRGNE